MYERKIPLKPECGLDLIREVVYGKWKIHLLYYIAQGIQRPGALQRQIPDAIRRVLNVQLNQLEAHELVTKIIYPELPPKVEYQLTELGKTLIPVINAMGEWGDTHKQQLRKAVERNLLIPEKIIS